MFNADKICKCSCLIVDKPLIGVDLFKTIFDAEFAAVTKGRA